MMFGLAVLKEEGAYYISGVEVTQNEYDEYKKKNPLPANNYYSLYYEEGKRIDTYCFNKAIEVIRTCRTDKYELLAAIAYEILNTKGY